MLLLYLITSGSAVSNHKHSHQPHYHAPHRHDSGQGGGAAALGAGLVAVVPPLLAAAALAGAGYLIYSTSGYYEAQFYSYPFPVLTFDTVCVPHSSRKCCIVK